MGGSHTGLREEHTGPGGWRAAGHGVAESQTRLRDRTTGLQRERREKTEQTQYLKRFPKQMKTVKPHIQKASQISNRVNTGEKHIHRHILVKLMKNRFFFSPGAPVSCKGTTVRMLTDFYTEMMAGWGRWKDILKVRK